MKFGKEFASQMVQEWQAAYMDYNALKQLLKDLLKYRQMFGVAASSPAGPHGSRSRSLRRKQSLYRAFSGLTGRLNNISPKQHEDEVILVNAVDGEEGEYHTMFLRSSEEGGQKELVYFKKLDDEFNKVLKFYREKVDEAKLKAEELDKQIHALIALRIRVEKPNVGHKFDQEIKAAPDSGNFPPANQGMTRMEVIGEIEMSSDSTSGAEKDKKDSERFRPAPLEVLDHVRINVHPETPVSTLRHVIGSSKIELSFSKEELKKAEEKLRTALTEFYQHLQLVKSYCFLNMEAFSKIMKKYDKITSRSASKSYLKMVDNSYLGASDEVNKLIARLEATFIKHFANGNRRKGMKSLRPGEKRDKHRTTFFMGLCTGSSIALIVAIVITIDVEHLFNHPERENYMQNIFPLYSLFGFIVLHMLAYGTDTYLWRRYRVNYPFIFGFKPGTELGFREIFLAASGLSVFALAAVLSNLDMDKDPHTKSYKPVMELVPLGLVIGVILIMICPFNIIHRSSRFFLLRCLWHCVCAPLYKVTLPDFFLADQLTSQVQALRSLQFYVCYYGWGDYKQRSNKCIDSHVYKILYIVVAIFPYLWRALQCLRRYVEEKDVKQGHNCLKYSSTIVALVMKTIYDLKTQTNDLARITLWRVMAASTSGVTTAYNTYWDIVTDWGLLQRNSKNPWLRDKLLISNKAVYYVAIVVNILLRLAWMQAVLNFKAPFIHKKAMVSIVASLEIIRRGIWNFFRLENEHFNNVGNYRAFKSVPLPFHYDDDIL